MSDTTAFGFGQFIPGYDFLQQLSQSSKGAGLPPFANWVAPTVSVEEIDKRIDELKSVQFWLEQNSRALTATIQALQVQKMTLSTLQGMNVNMADFARAFSSFGTPASGADSSPAVGSPASASNWPMDAGSTPKQAQQAASSSADQPAAAAAAAPSDEQASASEDAASGLAVQAMQWWGALTQQFQQIAAQALQDPAQQTALAQAASMATDFTKAAAQATSDMMRQAVSPVSTTPTPAAPAQKKPAARKTTAAKPSSAPKAAAPAAPAATTAAAPAPKPAARKAAATPAKKTGGAAKA